jgi:hypothetical protein
VEIIRETQKKIGSRALAIAVVFGLILVLLGQKTLAKGLVLGSLFSVFNFVLMGQVLPLLLAPSRRRSILISLGSIMGRYFLLAIPLLIAVKMTEFDFWATALGIFMVQIVIMGEHVFRLIFPGRMQGT